MKRSTLLIECFFLFNNYLEFLCYNTDLPSFTYIRRVRITSSGGEVGRLNTGGGAEVHSVLIMSPFNLSGIYSIISFNYAPYGHKIK